MSLRKYAGSPITAETAQTLNQMLAASLEQESSQALLPGYRLAGKTGTAQIPTEYGYDAYPYQCFLCRLGTRR